MPVPTRFLWATDDNYAAGAEPWSGQPNKIDPATARRDEGWVPSTRINAPNINYLLNEIGQWIDALYDITDTNAANISSNDTDISNLQSDLSDEITDREDADTALNSSLTTAIDDLNTALTTEINNLKAARRKSCYKTYINMKIFYDSDCYDEHDIAGDVDSHFYMGFLSRNIFYNVSAKSLHLCAGNHKVFRTKGLMNYGVRAFMDSNILYNSRSISGDLSIPTGDILPINDIASRYVYGDTDFDEVVVARQDVNLVMYRASGGAFIFATTGLTAGTRWYCCTKGSNDEFGPFLVGGDAGRIGYSDNPATGWTEITPVAASVVRSIATNRKSSTNHLFVAVHANGSITTSVTGESWSLVSSGVLSGKPLDHAAYLDVADRWICADINGGVFRSTDSAATTWEACGTLTQLEYLIGEISPAYNSRITMRVATDGDQTIVAVWCYSAPVTADIKSHASISFDRGDTWEELFLPFDIKASAVAYAHDRFIIAGERAYCSLICEE